MQWPPQHPITRLTIERERERGERKKFIKKKKDKGFTKGYNNLFWESKNVH